MLRLATALVCFSLQLSFLTTFVACILATVAGMLLNVTGLYRIPGLVRLSTLYSYMNVWELSTIVAVIFGLLVCGWQSALAYCLSCAGGWILAFIEEYLEDRVFLHRVPKLNGIPLVGAERSFINAFRLHAAQLGVQDDTKFDDSRIDQSDWKESLKRFDVAWPQVAMHFDYYGND